MSNFQAKIQKIRNPQKKKWKLRFCVWFVCQSTMIWEKVTFTKDKKSVILCTPLEPLWHQDPLGLNDLSQVPTYNYSLDDGLHNFVIPVSSNNSSQYVIASNSFSLAPLIKKSDQGKCKGHFFSDHSTDKQTRRKNATFTYLFWRFGLLKVIFRQKSQKSRKKSSKR